MKSFLTSLPSRIGGYAKSAWGYAMAHKIIAAVALAAVLGGGYWAYAAHKADVTTTQYVLARAATQQIESTVTASGEVAASHQLDLSPKASGEVTSVNVKAGDTVKAGQVIATIDATDAQKSVRDAQLSLQSAQISYTQAITSANNTITNGKTSLSTARDNGFDAVTSAEAQLATISQGLDEVLLGTSDLPGTYGQVTLTAYTRLIEDNEPGAEAARDTAHQSYDDAVASYEQTFALYQQATRDSSPEEVQQLLSQVAVTAAKMNQAVKDAQAFLQLVNTTVQQHNLLTTPPSLASQITTVNGYASTISNTTSSLSSAQSSITSAIQSYSSNTQSINGSTPLAIQSAELTLARAKQSLADAQADLADYVVRAPFDGTIAEVDVQKYDQASGKVATLITKEQYADISLNETDIASVRAGQKATLTFDAVEDLTIEGTVAQVNQIGSVSNGVTSYTVKIGFDTQDERVKPGMTVNASIVTASKEDALVVPSSAIKSQNGEYYVEVATMNSSNEAGAPEGAAASSTIRRMGTGSSTMPTAFPGAASSTASSTGMAGMQQRGGASSGRNLTVASDAVTITRVPVTIGIQSDTMTEITSGITSDQLVVSESLNASGSSTTQSSSSGLFGLFGGGSRATGAATGAARSTGGTSSGSSRSGSTGGGAGGGFSGPPPGM